MRGIKYFSILALSLISAGCFKSKGEKQDQQKISNQETREERKPEIKEYNSSSIFYILSKSIFTPEKYDIKYSHYLSSRVFEKDKETFKYIVFFESLFKYNKEYFDSQYKLQTIAGDDRILPGAIIANHIILKVSPHGEPLGVVHQYIDLYHGKYSMNSEFEQAIFGFDSFGNLSAYWRNGLEVQGQGMVLSEIVEDNFHNFIGDKLSDELGKIDGIQPVEFHLEDNPLVFGFLISDKLKVKHSLLRKRHLSDQLLSPFGRITSETLRYSNKVRYVLPGAIIHRNIERKTYLQSTIEMDFVNLNWILFVKCYEGVSADRTNEKFMGKLELHDNQLILKKMGTIDLDSFILRLPDLSFLSKFPKDCRPDQLKSFEGPLDYQIHLESR
ncbi:MAG: hypothetical protein IPJ71_19250 [Bdellovibrionales bacterium]|nr:hypothetical protein [Bdellovibrionales bacterium]